MHAHGVRRYVGVSGAGMDVPGDQKGGRDKAISFLIQKVGGAIAVDKRREYQLFAESDIDFTLARPPRLLDGPATGRYASDAHKPGRSNSIRRADLAAFLADVVEQGSYLRQAPFVSSA
ncbi:MAG TPA: NAD(P)H-binding protein, partial [Candidatus Nanopelagicales bacterium]